MFESFYGFSANPFRMSADEKFRFAHRGYVKAWSYLKYALEQGEGFVLITGRPGTGKTTLIRDMLSEIDTNEIEPVNLVSNQLQGEELLRLVALECGIQAQEFNKATLLTRIEYYALSRRQEGCRLVVIVDEAQNLSAHGLEELRLLSNLQTVDQPLFQIVLVGQEELRTLIYGQGMENITQRIVASCRLEPMQEPQVQEYVEHRLGIVGWLGGPKLESALFPLLYRITHGVPREINLVMSRLLLFGALEEKHTLNSDDLLVIAKELADENRLAFDQTELLASLKMASGDAKLASGHIETTAAAETDQDDGHADAETAADNEPETEPANEVAVKVENELETESANEVAVRAENELETEPANEVAVTLETEAEEEPAEQLSGIFANDKPGRGGETDQEVPPAAPMADNPDLWQPLPATPGGIDDADRIPGDDRVRSQGLYTDVDDLLSNDSGIKDWLRSAWRWIFYPVAIIALLIALVSPDPAEIRGLYDRGMEYWGSLMQQQPTKGDGTDSPGARRPEDNTPRDASISVQPAEDAPASAAAQESETIPVESPAETSEPTQTTRPEIPPDTPQSYTLTYERGVGRLSGESIALLDRLSQRLTTDQGVMVILTGHYSNGDEALKRLHEALARAAEVAEMMRKQGVAKERFVVEAKPTTDLRNPSTVEILLKPVR